MCVNGACKFMADFAFECPVKVFLELMGRPQERTREFMAWEHKLLHEHDLQEVIKGTRAVVDYLREQIEDRKKNPRDDLRSEEHTSELQSLMRISYGVFCLKKKTDTTQLPNNVPYRNTKNNQLLTDYTPGE